MKRILSLITLSLLLAVPGFSQKHTSARINLSLWKDIATQRTDSVGNTFLNIGLYSSMNRLNGLGVNALASVVRQEMNGIQFSAISNIVGGNINGIQVVGISNINGNNLTGVSIAGLVGITGNQSRGFMLSGLTNIGGEKTQGVIIGGLLNISGKGSSGLHLAGLSNIAGEEFKGIATAGLLNIVGQNLEGVQLSALGNIVANQMNGVQLGLANYTTKGKGLQIGLVNYYKDEFKGLRLGLVNATPNTRIQMMLFGGNATKFNAGVRFKNRRFYTILGGGTHYLNFGNEFSATAFYRVGLELPLYKQLFVSGDLGYQHIETFSNKDHGFPPRLYSLQARLNLEYRLTHKLGIFVTGGYSGSRLYNKNVTHNKGILCEAGVILF